MNTMNTAAQLATVERRADCNYSQMTRMAATAFGYVISASHVWIDENGRRGFFPCFGGDVDLDEGFAPLSNPAQAYAMEDKLRIEVSYRAVVRDGVVSQVISVRTQGHGGAIVHTVREGESTLLSRMYAVTQFAALHSLMEDGSDEAAPAN